MTKYEQRTRSVQRFVRLAEVRTTKALKLIRLIGNLSNRSNYSYSPEQVTKIFKALRTELKDAEDRFSDRSMDPDSVHFSLSEFFKDPDGEDS